jgi:AcrR family transcriptional regulator
VRFYALTCRRVALAPRSAAQQRFGNVPATKQCESAGAAKQPAPAARAARSAHERLLNAVVELADAHGYAALTVERILREAHASRASFYQYFSSVDDCFWSAYRLHGERLAQRVRAAVSDPGASEAVVLRVLAQEALERPTIARLLFSECLAATPVGLLERDALIARLQREAQPDQSAHTGRLPGGILIGGAFRFLAVWLDDRSLAEDPLVELLDWTGLFNEGPARGRWEAAVSELAPMRSASAPGVRRPAGRVRERIIRAATMLAHEKGVRALTVADISRGAAVSRRSFYNEFANKTAAVSAAYEDAFARALAAFTPAYFSASGWPERVWASGVAFSSFFGREPAISYLGFVECHAMGRAFSARAHANQLSFTLFLAEGHGDTDRVEVSRAGCALTALTIAELACHAARAGPGLLMRRLMPLGVYVALAPFLGCEQAASFVSDRVAEGAGAVAV